MTEEEKKNLLRTVLSDDYSMQTLQNFVEMEVVEKEMVKQWEDGEQGVIDLKLKQQIWERVVSECSGQKKKLISRVWLWRAAAVLIILISGLTWGLTSGNGQGDYVEILALNNQEYLLPDSSKVWMQAGSSIRFAKDFIQDRKVWQKGNAMFEVYKHQGSVFQVHVGNAFVEVKGTCFGIRQVDSIRCEVSLFRGAVDFNSQNNRTVMQTMQKLLYNSREGKVEKMGEMNHMNWEGDRFIFTNIRLDDLIEFMNGWYNMNIAIEENVDGDYNFTGGIRYDESVDEVLKKLCYVVNLRQREQEGKIILFK